MYNRSRIVIICAVTCAAIPGCRGGEEPETAAQAEVADAAVAAFDADSVYAPERERVALAPDRIYLTLDDHGWYARGEPLLYGNAPYQPAGWPVSASLTEMHHTGDYQGVDFYVRDGDEETILYVPVFEGYWQPFRPDTARRGAN